LHKPLAGNILQQAPAFARTARQPCVARSSSVLPGGCTEERLSGVSAPLTPYRNITNAFPAGTGQIAAKGFRSRHALFEFFSCPNRRMQSASVLF
ncbi:hypothetical protein, partial [Christensenella hongkongensis]|uniref:hypothetical protein n=1 Tax=Christensenella hongkongensis TaxID=270498 RepID=UPI002671F578